MYRLISEPGVALQMLKKGELDVMGLREIEWVRQTKSKKFNDNFYKNKYFLSSFSYIGWNQGREFFKDRRVRLAMTHLINRQADPGQATFRPRRDRHRPLLYFRRQL